MSGHSKWSTIKRQKAVTDSRRAATFTKLARLISVTARSGGGDPAMNFRLRLAIDKARSANLPNDNIERAIKAGTGEGKEGQAKEVVYEGFGPGGVAVIVNALTDNPNRTAAEVRAAFTKHGGSLGGQNSVAWMFRLRGLLTIPKQSVSATDREALELAAIDAGADDVREDGRGLLIECSPDRLPILRQSLDNFARGSVDADTALAPQNTVAVDGAIAAQLHELYDALEEFPDVTSLATNEA